MKDGHKERENRKEDRTQREELRKGGWWRHKEETMNTKGKSNQKGNQIFIKQLTFSPHTGFLL